MYSHTHSPYKEFLIKNTLIHSLRTLPIDKKNRSKFRNRLCEIFMKLVAVNTKNINEQDSEYLFCVVAAAVGGGVATASASYTVALSTNQRTFNFII